MNRSRKTLLFPMVQQYRYEIFAFLDCCFFVKTDCVR